MTTTAIELPMEQIREFCHKWQVTEFALFSSVLRDDFCSDSDIELQSTGQLTGRASAEVRRGKLLPADFLRIRKKA